MNYHLHVVKFDGSEIDRPILITVNPPEDDAPVIEYLTPTPPQIMLGETVNIDWKVTGPVHQVQFLIDDVVVLDPAPVQGNYQHTPETDGTHVYKLIATGPGGEDTEQVRVSVQTPPTDTPQPEEPTSTPTPEEPTPTPEPPAPEPPAIYGFEVVPAAIGQGQSVMISWTTGGGTSYIEIRQEDSVIWTDTQLSNSVPYTIQDQPGSTIKFTLVAYNNAGLTDVREAYVQVVEVTAQNLHTLSRWLLNYLQRAGDFLAL
jgi:hypothetical protein